MSEQTFDQQAVTQYLLGVLPEAERVRLDELSVTDDEFAEALDAAEKDLVDAYVQGELTGAALEQFKSHYLASPLRREKVKFAQVFQVFAEQNAGTRVAGIQAESPAKSATKRKGAGWFSGLSAFFAPRFALQWGLTVAALALLIAGSWLAFENLRMRQQMSQTQARRDSALRREQDLQKELEGQRSTSAHAEQELARVREERGRLEQELKKAQGVAKPSPPGEGGILAVILAPPLRGAGQLPTVSIKTGTSVVAMQLQLEAADYSAYRVALIDPANNQTLWRSRNLKPRIKSERKAIAVSFSAGLLKRQNYILRVAGIPASGGSEIVGDYPFKVVK
jgi:hypothetical protein